MCEENGDRRNSDDSNLESDECVLEITPEDEHEVHKNRAEELLEQLQRMQAEFDNFRKRMENRFADAARFASEGILLRLLEVYDNIERALKSDFAADPVAAREGIAAIHAQIGKILTQEEVKPIESLGKPFDPYYQHSASKVNNPQHPDGVVVEVYQKGYMLKEKVLRPAVVCVNRLEHGVSTTTEARCLDDKEEMEGEQE